MKYLNYRTEAIAKASSCKKCGQKLAAHEAKKPKKMLFSAHLLPSACLIASVVMALGFAGCSDGTIVNSRTEADSGQSSASQTTTAAELTTAPVQETPLEPETTVSASQADETRTTEPAQQTSAATASTTEMPAPQEADWGTLYADYLRNYRITYGNPMFDLVYIDDDDIPEMLISERDTHDYNSPRELFIMCSVHNGTLHCSKLNIPTGIFGFSANKNGSFFFWDEYTYLGMDSASEHTYLFHLDKGSVVSDGDHYFRWNDEGIDQYIIDGKQVSKAEYYRADPTLTDDINFCIGGMGPHWSVMLGSYELTEYNFSRVLINKDFYNTPEPWYN